MRHVREEVVIRGIALSPGIVVGRACFLNPPSSGPPRGPPSAIDPAAEERRLLEGLRWLGDRVRELARVTAQRVGSEAAQVFEAHGMILEDPVLREELIQAIHRERLCAETAVARHLEAYEAQLRASPHPYLRDRAGDIASLKHHMTAHLRADAPLKHCVAFARCGVDECPGQTDHVLVASELTPSLTLETDARTIGFVVERGGPTSHAAILAQGLGLPAVGGIASPLERIPPEALVLVDGDRGEVILNPADARLADLVHQGRVSRIRVVPPVEGLRVLANIDGVAGAIAARRALAEGVGLYRTELEVMAEGRLLTEDEQTSRYSQVLDAMGERPVYIRLLDIGSDKVGDFLEMPRETNPALGIRGARLLLARPELLRPQARALARAALRRPIHVIYPMIQDVDQFRRLRQAFADATADLPPARLSHGVMFEIPSACLRADALFEVAEFGCVGTNDLIQYLFAADRDSDGLDSRSFFRHPALWDVLGRLSAAASAAGKELSVCGALGADPDLTRCLMAIGIGTVSTPPAAIARVREAAGEE